MFRRQPLSELQENLSAVNDQLDAHPFASPQVKRAHEIIDNRDDKDNAAVELELEKEGLPSLEELGRIQLKHTGSWWRLNRDRNKLLKQITKLGG